MDKNKIDAAWAGKYTSYVTQIRNFFPGYSGFPLSSNSNIWLDLRQVYSLQFPQFVLQR